jgi:TonB family protein
MPAEKKQPLPANEPRRRRIVVPKGFPAGAGWPAAHIHAQRTRASRLSGPMGAFALHGALIALVIHVQAIREVFGQRTADEREWTWLPEVTLVAQPPATAQPPSPVEEPPPPPESELPLEALAPIEIAPDEVPREIVPEPAPESPPAAAETAAAADPDAWTEVRRGIMESLRYPVQARRSGIAGTATLLLRLDEAGRVVSVEIKPPAPAKPLCAAVLAAVRRAGPFPAIGEAIRQGRTPAQAELSIRFQLDDSRP